MEPLALFESCDEDEVMEIESLDEDPQIVSHDNVVEESEYKFAGPVLFIKSPKNSYKVDKHVLTFPLFLCVTRLKVDFVTYSSKQFINDANKVLLWRKPGLRK